MRWFNRILLVLVVLPLITVVACDEGGPDAECLTDTPCVDNSDCDSGRHCNLALATPMCQVLYCGQGGSGCSEDELCADRNCVGKICVNKTGTAEGEMVLIPAGSFWMGCNSAVDSQCNSDESPYHEVTLSGYYLDKTEVTQDAYKLCVDAGECAEPVLDWDPSSNPDKPVVYVDWTQAKDYCAWAGKRLPTEAEWEKAARGTDGRKYPWGNETATCDYAVMYEDGESGCGTGSTWDVCSKSPAGDSPYGLCDMSGNVWEWVSDRYGSDYYTNSPSSNPTGPVSGFYRVARGDGFDYEGGNDGLRASIRIGADPSDHYNVGFRCAKDAP